VVLSGEQIDPKLFRPLNGAFLPHTLRLAIDKNNRHMMQKFAPFTQQHLLEKQATLYLCQGFSCETPLQGEAAIEARLKKLL